MLVKGFTIRKLKKTALFGNGVIETDEQLDLTNELEVSFCSAARHEQCMDYGSCSKKTPICYRDDLKMVGKSIGGHLTDDDYKKIEAKLEKYLDKCRPVSVEIKLIK